MAQNERRTSGNHPSCQMLRWLLLVTALVAGQAQALAPEHEQRRLMLATEQAVQAEHWGEAGEYLNQLQQMATAQPELKPPAEYYYYRGLVMLQAGHLNEAQSAFEAYVDGAGAEGRFYKDALERITDTERARKQQAAKAATGQTQPEKVATIKPASQQSLAALRKLYLTDSNRKALLLHLNSLLDLAGWREGGERVGPGADADIGYRVTATNDAINLQTVRRNADNRQVRTTTALTVYGINPMIRWGCEDALATCWVYDPRDGSRMMQLALAPDTVGDIAHTLGRLIKELQAPSR